MKIKLRRYYCQRDTGPKVRCWYSIGKQADGTHTVTIRAKEHGDHLADVFPADRVRNYTDHMTDYFEKDRVIITQDDPLFVEACVMANAKHKGAQ